jgi:hypothetical protein
MLNGLTMKKHLKKFALATIFICVASFHSFAQTELPGLDKSPMDMSYCPDGYSFRLIDTGKVQPLIARVTYSRPQKNGRVIFGGLVPYGQVWRLGANEATELEIFQPVLIGNQLINKGRYTLYAIPDSAKWTIILNSETDVWGAFSYEISKDLVRVEVPVQKQAIPTEALTMLFTDKNGSQSLLIYWDNVKVELPMRSRWML